MLRTLLVAFALLVGVINVARAADPDALWKIVHDRCVPDQQAHANPAPCEAVALNAGYAILKDIRGATQFLLIPTARVSGIEDPAILTPDAPNYFLLAWSARGRVSSRAGYELPDDAISLAINSFYGRTQNQLHIHIDCIRPDVRAALATNISSIGANWTPFDVPLVGRNYRARRIHQLNENPFDLVAASLTNVRGDMPKHTLVLTAAQTGGFILLDGIASLAAGNPGSGEELQDHECELSKTLAHPG